MDFYSVSSLIQQYADRHVAPSRKQYHDSEQRSLIVNKKENVHKLHFHLYQHVEIILNILFFQISLYLLFTAISYCTTSATRHNFRYRTLHTLTNESMAIIPGRLLNYQTGDLCAVPPQFINIKLTDIDNQVLNSNVYLTQRSSCPWKFVKNFDVNRIPNEIYEAKCRTSTCLSSGIEGCIQQRCEEVKYFTWVKRKTGPSRYEKMLEPISVGCTCACAYLPTVSDGVRRLVMHY